MRIGDKELRDFEEADLLALVEKREPESQTIEFKQEMYRSDDASKREMLKDISAMANHIGGAIFIGIAEEDNCASQVVGLDNGEENESRIRKSCRDNIEEFLTGLETKAVHLQSGKCVVIIEIPDGNSKPYMVNFKGHRDFYKRDGTDNHPMSTKEIKELANDRQRAKDAVDEYFERRVHELRRIYDTEPNIVLSILPSALYYPDIEFETDAVKALFDNSGTTNRFAFCSTAPEFNTNSVKSAYLAGYGPDSVRVTYEVFENGYVEVIGFSKELYKIWGDAHHPFVLLRILLNGATLLKRMNAIVPPHPPYVLKLWFTSLSGFRLFGPPPGDRRSSKWVPWVFKGEEFLISQIVTGPVINEEKVIHPIFRKLLRIFKFPETLYYQNGVIADNYRRDL